VPIFKDFMAEALKDAPVIPFRVPPGVRQVQINSETGARARPGDKHVIWEAFLAGTEPSDKIYILDGSGISLMSSYRRDIPIPEGVDTEMLSDQEILAPYAQPYSGAMPGSAPIGPQLPPGQNNQPATTTPQAVMTGTGGLY
jgi:penicillin-binding protein 1A